MRADDEKAPVSGDGAPESGEAPQTFREIERKYRIHGLFRLPELVGSDRGVASVDDAQTIVLTATYYDTADLCLAREGITLRRRVGGSDEGWHLKLPVPDEAEGVRDEVRLPLDGSEVVPDALADLVTAYVRRRTLEPVATLETHRTVYVLRDAEGTVLAELTDDSVSVLDSGHIAARFRELELESRAADESTIDAIGRQLEAAGALAGSFVSKVARALGPLAAAPPDVPEPGTVRPSDPAADAVRAHLARNVRAFQLHDVGVRRDLPDAVHQMRVAARRLRSGLKVFGPLVEKEWADRLREELKWIAGALGDVRDREVLEKRLLRDLDVIAKRESVDSSKAEELVHRCIDDAMAQAREAVFKDLRSDRYLTILDELVRAANDPVVNPSTAQGRCSDELPPLVTKEWKRLRHGVSQLEMDGPDHEWHEARIAAKRARYATEALAPVFGRPAKRLAERFEEVTDLLGEHQDAAVAATEVRQMTEATQPEATAAFSLGLLYAEQRDAVSRARLRFVAIWPKVSRPRWRRWLG